MPDQRSSSGPQSYSADFHEFATRSRWVDGHKEEDDISGGDWPGQCDHVYLRRLVGDREDLRTVLQPVQHELQALPGAALMPQEFDLDLRDPG